MKLFTIEQEFNPQNDRILFKTNLTINFNLRAVTREQFSSSLIVWAGITSKSKTPLIFLEKGVKVNVQVHCDQIL